MYDWELAVEMGIAVKIKNIGESRFSRFLLLRLDAYTGLPDWGDAMSLAL